MAIIGSQVIDHQDMYDVCIARCESDEESHVLIHDGKRYRVSRE
jgi:hypothetical protein